jgi:hypothetical protein
MDVTGPEEECSGTQYVPGVVVTGTYATQKEPAAEVEKLFRGTRLYCERGCARAVKRTKIEAAAVEVASEEWSAI